MWNFIGFGELSAVLEKCFSDGQVLFIDLDTLNTLEDDKAAISSNLLEMAQKHTFSFELTEWEEAIHEMIRSGNVELHNMAAILGGMASQEIIKLITHQYIPMNNTLVYDGIHSTSTVIQVWCLIFVC